MDSSSRRRHGGYVDPVDMRRIGHLAMARIEESAGNLGYRRQGVERRTRLLRMVVFESCPRSLSFREVVCTAGCWSLLAKRVEIPALWLVAPCFAEAELRIRDIRRP